MATIADFRTQLEAAITAAVPSVTFPTDPVSEDVPIGGGGTIAQVSAVPAFRTDRDMNQRATLVSVRVRVAHLRAAPAGTFEAWMEGTGATLATLLCDPLTYAGLASVLDSNVEDKLSISQALEFDGLVCWFDVSLAVTLVP